MAEPSPPALAVDPGAGHACSHLLTHLPTRVYQCRRTEENGLDSTSRLTMQIQLSDMARTTLETSYEMMCGTATGPPAASSTLRQQALTTLLKEAVVVDILNYDYTIPTFFRRFTEDETSEDINGDMIIIPPPSVEVDICRHQRGVLNVHILPRTLPISSTHGGRPFRLIIRVIGGEVLTSTPFMVFAKEPSHSSKQKRARGQGARVRRAVAARDADGHHQREEFLMDAVEELFIMDTDVVVVSDATSRLLARLLYIAFCDDDVPDGSVLKEVQRLMIDANMHRVPPVLRNLPPAQLEQVVSFMHAARPVHAPESSEPAYSSNSITVGMASSSSSGGGDGDTSRGAATIRGKRRREDASTEHTSPSTIQSSETHAMGQLGGRAAVKRPAVASGGGVPGFDMLAPAAIPVTHRHSELMTSGWSNDAVVVNTSAATNVATATTAPRSSSPATTQGLVASLPFVTSIQTSNDIMGMPFGTTAGWAAGGSDAPPISMYVSSSASSAMSSPTPFLSSSMVGPTLSFGGAGSVPEGLHFPNGISDDFPCMDGAAFRASSDRSRYLTSLNTQATATVDKGTSSALAEDSVDAEGSTAAAAASARAGTEFSFGMDALQKLAPVPVMTGGSATGMPQFRRGAAVVGSALADPYQHLMQPQQYSIDAGKAAEALILAGGPKRPDMRVQLVPVAEPQAVLAMSTHQPSYHEPRLASNAQLMRQAALRRHGDDLVNDEHFSVEARSFARRLFEELCNTTHMGLAAASQDAARRSVSTGGGAHSPRVAPRVAAGTKVGSSAVSRAHRPKAVAESGAASGLRGRTRKPVVSTDDVAPSPGELRRRAAHQASRSASTLAASASARSSLAYRSQYGPRRVDDAQFAQNTATVVSAPPRAAGAPRSADMGSTFNMLVQAALAQEPEAGMEAEEDEAMEDDTDEEEDDDEFVQ